MSDATAIIAYVVIAAALIIIADIVRWTARRILRAENEEKQSEPH